MDFDLSIINDLMIGGVAIVPIIIGVVALLKKIPQFKPGYAPYAAGALAAVSYVVVTYLLPLYPQIMTFAEPAAYSVYIFLIVSGVVQLSKTSK